MYQGASSRVAAPSSVGEIPTIGLEHATKSLHQGLEAMGAVGARFIKLQDYGSSQQVERKVRDLTAGFDTEFQRRLSLASGSSDALHDETGKVIQGRIEDMATSYAKKVDEIQGNFINAGAINDVQDFKANAAASFQRRAYGLAAQDSTRRTRQSFADNYELAVERGDYLGAASSIDKGVDAGLFTADKAALMLLKLGQHKKRKDLAAMRASGQEGAAQAQTVLWNEHYDGKPKKGAGLTLPERGVELDLANDALARSSASIDINTGGHVFNAGAGASTEMEESCALANIKGGMSFDDYDKHVVKQAAAIASNPAYAGLSDVELAAMIKKSVYIDGGENMLFEGDKAAYDSSLQQRIDNIIQTRDLIAYSKDAKFGDGELGRDGLGDYLDAATDKSMLPIAQARDNMSIEGEPLSSLEQSSLVRFEKELKDPNLTQELRDKIIPQVEAYKKRRYTPLAGEFERCKDKFARETGIELEHNEVFGDERDKFVEWYYKSGGENERINAIHRKDVRNVALRAAVNASVDYTLSGGDNWAEEELVMRKAVDASLSSGIDLTNARSLATYYDEQDRALEEFAKGYRKDAALHLPQIVHEQRKAAAKVADAAKEKKSYALTQRGNVSWDGVDASGSPPIVYVSPDEYHRIINAHDAHAHAGVMVQVGDYKTKLPVHVKDGIEGLQLNQAAMNKVYKNAITPETAKQLLNTHQEKFKYSITL